MMIGVIVVEDEGGAARSDDLGNVWTALEVAKEEGLFIFICWRPRGKMIRLE